MATLQLEGRMDASFPDKPSIAALPFQKRTAIPINAPAP
jgi:hypothetical protein